MDFPYELRVRGTLLRNTDGTYECASTNVRHTFTGAEMKSSHALIIRFRLGTLRLYKPTSQTIPILPL